MADIYGVVKYGDWTPLYETLQREITWYSFPLEIIREITAHTKRPQHSCCLICRRFLAELGLFLHKLHKRVFDTVTTMSRYYNFKLTADNVDLNGILDYEDYAQRTEPQEQSILDVIRAMAPYYQMLYSYYEHVGMYFITHPIYPTEDLTTDNLLIQFENVITELRENSAQHIESIFRPSIETFAEYLHLNTYAIKPTPIYDAYQNERPCDIPEWIIENDINLNIHPVTKDYIDCDEPIAYEQLAYTMQHFKISYRTMNNFKLYYADLLQHNIQVLSLYVPDHPYRNDHHIENMKTNLNIWVHAKYDANVNLAHFDSLNYEKTGYATFPIIGKVKATLPSQCEECKERIPDDILSVYDFGSNIHAKAQLKPGFGMVRHNPLVEFDTALQKVGDFIEQSDYAYDMKTRPILNIDSEFQTYMKETQGMTVLTPPLIPNPIVHDPDTTYSSPYYIKTPDLSSIKEDLELFNQHTYGAASPTVTLLALDMLKQLLTDEVLASTGQPNCPIVPDQVPIRNKHKSSGTPYRKYGDSEFMRDIYSDYRNDLVYHKRHSVDQALTLIINKVAISTKHRDRTILAINVNKSEAGRSLFRWFLDKIKATANEGGPILIGLVAQYGGWDKLYKNLYKDFPVEKDTILLGGKDYPKWDRRIVNLFQFLTTSLFYALIDPIVQLRQNNANTNETWHEYLAEVTQIVFDYLVFGSSLYQKPGGVTSGNSRTADGNSFLHLLLDMYATIMQLIQSTPENFPLEREVRDKLAKIVLETIPADYVQQPDYYYQPEILNHIRSKIAKGAVLSDDGLFLHDTRIIDYDDFMHESLMLSTYDIPNNRHKYHQDPPARKAREFLSQDTFEFGDMSYPLPEFGRIYGALVLSDNNNTHDPSIYISRFMSLYAFLYCYYYKLHDQPDHSYVKFLDAARKYIDSKLEHQDDTFLDTIPLQLDNTENVFDFKSGDMFEIFDRLWGFDKSSDYIAYLKKNRHRYPKLSLLRRTILEQDTQHTTQLLNENRSLIVTFCYVCGGNAYITCNNCCRAFCNNLDSEHGSHLEQHYVITQHRKYTCNARMITCSSCFENDVSKLHRSKDEKYHCETHKPQFTTPLIQTTSTIPHFNLRVTGNENFFNQQNLITYNKIHKDYSLSQEDYDTQVFKHLYYTYKINESDVSNLIRSTMRLSSYGIVRPYYQLLMQLTQRESRALDTDVVDIPILNIDNSRCEQALLEIPQIHKFDHHASYYVLDNEREIPIHPTYHSLSKSKTHLWSLAEQLHCTPKIIRQKRLNTLSTILRTSTRHIPEYLKLLMSWNTNLSVYEQGFDHVPATADMSASIREKVNDLITLLNARRFQIIFGGPGTGKSTTLANLIQHLHSQGKRILVYTPSHQSANSLLYKIADIFKQKKINRPGLVRILTEGMKENANLLDNHIITYRECMQKTDRITVTTIQSYSAVAHIDEIDLVILDEFSLTPDNYLLAGLSHLKQNSRVLFTGDPRQLSTVDDIRRDLNPRYHSLINFYTETYPSEVYVLKDHYRCHPEIFSFFKDLYYSDKDIRCLVHANDRVFNPLQPINVIHVEKPNYRNCGVVLNEDEYEQIHELLKYIKDVLDFYDNRTVAIICSYRSQLQRFVTDQRAGLIPASVTLSTIDSAQGDEFDVVILCLTQANNFTFNPNRLNVAISRTRCALFMTLPPLENAYSFEHKEVYMRLYERPCFVAYPLYNQGTGLRQIQSPTTLINQARTLYKNPRDIMPDYRQKFPINILMCDHIYFDTEFLNPNDSASEPVMLAYGYTHTAKGVTNSRSISGIPNRYVQDGNYIKSVRFDFMDRNRPLRSTYRVAWLKDKPEFSGIESLVREGLRTNTVVDIKHLIEYARKHIHTKPTFVTYSGKTDHQFLYANTLFPPVQTTCSSPRCVSPPIYATRNGPNITYYCAYHAAQQERDTLTHFVNIDIIDLRPNRTLEVSELQVYHNATLLHKIALPKTITSMKLQDLHAYYCKEHRMLDAHQPHNDAMMTKCIYKEAVIPALTHIIYDKLNISVYKGMNYRLKDFDVDMCTIRRKLQETWYQSYASNKITHCNMGAGKNPLSYATCQVDIINGRSLIQQDMNKHVCEAAEEIYFDSHFYKTTPYNKPAYIFYDNNAAHYEPIGNQGQYLYLNSKTAQYIHALPDLKGTDVFLNEYFDNCSNEMTHHSEMYPTNYTSLPYCFTSADNRTNEKGRICQNHLPHVKTIGQIAIATDYGYQFIKVEPETQLNNHAYQLPSDTWDPRHISIPGYTTRPKASPAHMQDKARGVLYHIQMAHMFTNNTLSIGRPVYNFGASSIYGQTPMADEFQRFLPDSPIINVDPRLSCDNKITYFKNTISEMLSLGKYTQLIISDVHNNETPWLDDLFQFAQKYLEPRGTLAFKITAGNGSPENLAKIADFAQYFKYASVKDLNVVPVSSELWVILSDYSPKPPVLGWNTQNLALDLRRQWYNKHQGNVPSKPSTFKLSRFKYTPRKETYSA